MAKNIGVKSNDTGSTPGKDTLLMPTEAEQEAPLSRHVAAVAEARFRASSHTALRGISCKSIQGVLVLEGRLSTFFQKQLAQEIVSDIKGVKQVVNQIEVVSRAT